MHRTKEEIVRLKKDSEYMENHIRTLESKPEDRFECVPGFEFYKKLLEAQIKKPEPKPPMSVLDYDI